MKVMKVWVVTVFESANGTTRCYGVYDSLEKALNRKNEFEENEELISEGHYLQVYLEEFRVE